uniref:Uncharacterized protein n=1 Tax=Arundo donax TaxID=35708 RepID=A0A0A9B1L2_ARUDO
MRSVFSQTICYPVTHKDHKATKFRVLI